MQQISDLTDLADARSHFFRLYASDDNQFIESVASYVSDGLLKGESVIVVATKEHTASLEVELKRCGAQPFDARKSERL